MTLSSPCRPFSRATDAGSDKPSAWSVPLLHEMNWSRFRELIRSLVHQQGFQTTILSEQPDGGIIYGLTPKGRGAEMTAILQCPSWRSDEIDLAQVSALDAMVRHHGVRRGLLVTSGHVTMEARSFARQKPVELVDGWELLDWVAGLPEDLQAEYLKLSTVGDYRAPACPSCGGRMVMETSQSDEDVPRMMGNLVVRESRFISWPVRCRALVVKAGVEVHFRRGVVAESIEVYGRAVGEMLCTGLLTVGSEGVVAGGVACRRVSLAPGGSLEGEAVILKDGEWAPEALAGEWFRQPNRVWRCTSFGVCQMTLEARL
jgi:cytoskeletal protein CcmA (bactofilin family)